MEKSTIVSMALGIPAVVIAVIALALAFNASGVILMRALRNLCAAS